MDVAPIPSMKSSLLIRWKRCPDVPPPEMALPEQLVDQLNLPDFQHPGRMKVTSLMRLTICFAAASSAVPL